MEEYYRYGWVFFYFCEDVSLIGKIIRDREDVRVLRGDRIFLWGLGFREGFGKSGFELSRISISRS